MEYAAQDDAAGAQARLEGCYPYLLYCTRRQYSTRPIVRFCTELRSSVKLPLFRSAGFIGDVCASTIEVGVAAIREAPVALQANRNEN